MIRGESRNRASCEVSDVGITSFHACLSAAFLMEGCRAATLVTPGRALLRGGASPDGHPSRLYFTALFHGFIGPTQQILSHYRDTGFRCFSCVRQRAVNRVLCVAKIYFIRTAENNKWKIPK
jgi:hypothetical protein